MASAVIDAGWKVVESCGQGWGTHKACAPAPAKGHVAAARSCPTCLRASQVHFVHGRCLVHHSPNPQQCALNGSVWDDTEMMLIANFGGRCISQEDAQNRLDDSDNRFEVRGALGRTLALQLL